MLIRAYNDHQHLVLRPDDVWQGSQFSLYIQKNAEDLRHIFVQHEGQRHLEVQVDSMDFNEAAPLFLDELKKNVSDPSFVNWFMPDFSTTVSRDKIVACVQCKSIFPTA